MGSNIFFNQELGFQPEQNLVQDLVDEMIGIYAWTIYYLPRQHNNQSAIFTEDASSYFNQAIQIDAYVNTFDGFTGQGDILAKFGLSTADQLTVSISRRIFEQNIGRQLNFIRPREGDLLFFPLTNGLFQITFVEHEASFYQQGALYFWQISTEKFDYANEKFTTGIPQIDIISTKYDTSTENFYFLLEKGGEILLESGDHLVAEEFQIDLLDPGSQNEEFDQQADTFEDFNETDPFNDGGKY